MLFHVAERINNALHDQAVVETVDKIAKTTVAAGSSGGMVIGGLNISEWAAVGSFLIAAAGLAFHIWFTLRYKRPRRR